MLLTPLALFLYFQPAFRGSSSSRHLLNNGPSANAHPAGSPELVVPDLQHLAESTSPDTANKVLQLERQGKGRKVISMSLFGDDGRYTQGVIENAVLARRDWRGWTLRVYYGAGVPSDVLNIVTALGVELVSMADLNITQSRASSTVWRFLALTDRTATRIISRDADARLTNRDKAAVDEWVESGKYFHVMRDHVNHKKWPVLAGMFGAVNGLLHPRLVQAWFGKNETSEVANAPGAARAKWWSDQVWLRDSVWPLVKVHTLSHASFGCGDWGEAQFTGYPTQRQDDYDVVGATYRPRELGRWMAGRGGNDTCPQKCRRQLEWTKC